MNEVPVRTASTAVSARLSSKWERDFQVFAARARGAMLAELAAEHHVTQARIRQLLERFCRTRADMTVAELTALSRKARHER